jgi:hypothetical protein
MNDRIRARLAALEPIYQRPAGCATCRTWSPVAWSEERIRPDGAALTTLPRPVRCPDCGREVPIRLTRHYVRVDGGDDGAAA